MLAWNMTVSAVFNFVEAGLWISFGIALFIFSGRFKREKIKLVYLGAVSLVAFGISDVVEVYSGAWWKPIWLLVLKGLCILIFVLCLIFYRKSNV
jgi:hypothetical protein